MVPVRPFAYIYVSDTMPDFVVAVCKVLCVRSESHPEGVNPVLPTPTSETHDLLGPSGNIWESGATSFV